MIDLGTLRLGIKVDSDSAKSQLGEVSNSVEDTGSKVTSLASAAKKMISAFAATEAVKALTSIGKAALEAYGEFEQLEGGVNKIFGDSAQEVIKNAENAYKTAGISANEYMEQVTSFSSSLLQSLGGDTAAAAKIADMAVQDMADNANTFGTDVSLIQNAYQGFAKQNYTMLDNLKLGYGGTKEEMERLLADAKELTGVEYDINNLDDVYNAIHAIQEEMGVTGTTSKEASQTIEGSMNALKASWQNLLTSIGSGEGLNTAVSNFISSLGSVAQNIIPTIVNIVGGIVQSIILAIPELMLALADAIGSFAESLDEAEGTKFIDAGLALIKSLASGLLKALPELLIAVGKLALSLVNKFREINLLEVGKAIISSLLSGLKAAWTALKNWVTEKVEWIKSKFTSAKNSSGTGHRIGISDVPYDGYAAILHKGERVLTANENNQYTKALNGMTESLLNGMAALNSMDGSGASTVNLVVNLGGAKVAEQVFKLNKQGALALQG